MHKSLIVSAVKIALTAGLGRHILQKSGAYDAGTVLSGNDPIRGDAMRRAPDSHSAHLSSQSGRDGSR
jgi:hypothetical protein